MLDIVKQTIDFYMKNLRKPEINELNINNKDLLWERASCFVTLYHKWNIRWSAWNIKEISQNTIEELIENTIHAISEDKRFSKLSLQESKELKIRVDKIISRELVEKSNINKIEPTSSWVIVLKKDYEKMACILPNIDAKILTWEDYTPILEQKLNEKNFNPDDYHIYMIKTETETDY